MKRYILAFILFLFSTGMSWAQNPCDQMNIQLNTPDDGMGAVNFSINYTPLTGYDLIDVEWNFGDGSPVQTNTSTTIFHQYYGNSGQSIFPIGVVLNFEELATHKIINCGVGSDLEFDYPLPDSTEITCPVAAFVAHSGDKWCNSSFSWTFCNEDYDGDGSPDNYWTPDFVEWNFGDGQTGVSQGGSSIYHNYSIAQLVNVTATAYFTGTNGETCAIGIVDILSSNSTVCDLAADPTILNASFLPYLPNQANAGLYAQTPSGTFCSNETISIFNNGEFVQGGVVSTTPSPIADWSYELFIDGQSVTTGNGIPSNLNAVHQTTLPAGDYSFEIVYSLNHSVYGYAICSFSESILVTVVDCEQECENCHSFRPEAGERYWISAWVQEDVASQVLSYNEAHLSLEFVGANNSVEFYTSGEIIEGWQRIVGSFTIPVGTTDLNIHLKNDGTADAFYDDIRIHPFNASMKSYVYDPETYWLTAELDDNNYATFYEYDKEGQLIRIKKETARGIMTIQESRSSNPKGN